jgi:hypothetical protein
VLRILRRIFSPEPPAPPRDMCPPGPPTNSAPPRRHGTSPRFQHDAVQLLRLASRGWRPSRISTPCIPHTGTAACAVAGEDAHRSTIAPLHAPPPVPSPEKMPMVALLLPLQHYRWRMPVDLQHGGGIDVGELEALRQHSTASLQHHDGAPRRACSSGSRALQHRRHTFAAPAAHHCSSTQRRLQLPLPLICSTASGRW